jgi:hypothetical protein
MASGNPATTAPSTRWPPLTATTSPPAIGSTACTPRPAMALAPPFTAFGVIHDRSRGGSSQSPAGIPPCRPMRGSRRAPSAPGRRSRHSPATDDEPRNNRSQSWAQQRSGNRACLMGVRSPRCAAPV